VKFYTIKLTANACIAVFRFNKRSQPFIGIQRNAFRRCEPKV